MPVSWHSRFFGALGDGDVLDHRAEHRASGRVGLLAHQALEAFLDVGRQQLQRAHVKCRAQLLDLLGIDLHPEAIARASTRVQQKAEPEREPDADTGRNHCARAFANAQELDRQHAQAQRHVQCERRDQPGFRQLDERIVG